MPTGTGVFTNAYRQKYANLADGTVSNPVEMPLLYFLVGEGGFQTVDGVKVPKTPDPSRTALESTLLITIPVTPPPGGPLPGETSVTGGYFPKALVASDVVVSASNVTVTCVLSANEPFLDNLSKLDPQPSPIRPQLFELGLFDGGPDNYPFSWGLSTATMMAYCTFPLVVKHQGIPVTIRVDLTL